METPDRKIDPQTLNHGLPKDQYTHVIALVHGIRDIGAWQKTVSSQLMVKRGVQVVQIRYGQFSAWRFLFPLPIFFAGPMKRVADGLNNLRNEYPNAKLSVIAHSFGTFLTLRVLRANPLIQLWKLVFCGSVADDIVDWSSLRNRVGDSKLPTKEFIVNDCGTGDFWPVLGTAFGWYYGMAGAVGFSEEYVTNRFHRGKDGSPGAHSLYFDPIFVEREWRPFLVDDAPIGSGDGRQGEHLSFFVRLFYTPFAQWIARLCCLAAWLLPIACMLFAWQLYSSDGTKAGVALPPPPVKSPTTIRVAIKQWVGYTPMAVADQMGFFADSIKVEFVDVDTVAAMQRELVQRNIDIAMALVETHVRASEGYADKVHDENRPVVILKIDTSRGADGIVAVANILSVNDLGIVDGETRNFLFQKHDVSHFLFKHLFQLAGKSFRDFKDFAEDANPEAAAELFSDAKNAGRRTYFAAGTYEPYLTLARDPMDERFYSQGSHILIDSDQEGVRDLIVDVMTTRRHFLDEHRSAVEAFLRGWFRAVDALQIDSSADHDRAMEFALQFNGLPEQGTDWSCKTWPKNSKCAISEYLDMIAGLRGKHRSEADKELPWPNRQENVEFFKRPGDHPSMFDTVFEKCKQLREGRSLDELDPRDFDGSFVVVELTE